jgi:Tfp pilus assembly protein PilN
VAFDQGVVRIRGFGSENAVVNSWIEKLQHTDWVKQVKLQSYGNTATENSGAFFIELELK